MKKFLSSLFGVLFALQVTFVSINRNQSVTVDWPSDTVDCTAEMESLEYKFSFFREGGSEIYTFVIIPTTTMGQAKSYPLTLNFVPGVYYMESAFQFKFATGEIAQGMPCNSATKDGCVNCGPYANYQPWKLGVKPDPASSVKVAP